MVADYLRVTRTASFNAFMVLGLLAVYEGGILLSGSSRRNAADVMLDRWLDTLGPAGTTVLHAALFVLSVALGLAFVWRGEGLLRHLPLFGAECTVWAAVLAPVAFALRQPFLAAPASESLLLDVGAGVYEEIVFRYLAVGIPLALMRLDPFTVFEDEDGLSAPVLSAVARIAFVVLASSVAFAAYHHVGAGAEPWDTSVFWFRSAAGIILALLYLVRGLAVAVYTHAFYDILIHLA